MTITSNLLPIDIFSTDENHWYSYYSIQVNGEHKKHAWIIVSAGPDNDYDCDAPKVFDLSSTTTLHSLKDLHYDPTNGAISSGDLITCSEWKL